MKWLGCRNTVLLMSTIVGLASSTVSAQTGTSPTVTVRRNTNLTQSVWPGDFNGDGIKDIIVGSGTDAIQIYPGRADGTYPEIVALSGGLFIHGAVLGDFNGDGKQDLAVANHYGQSVTVFLNQGAFTFVVADIPLGMQTNSVAAGDLNRAGKTDRVG